MKIIFVRTYTDDDGNEYTPGTVREVPEEAGRRLIREKVAQERSETRGPSETKDYEPEPEEGGEETEP